MDTRKRATYLYQRNSKTLNLFPNPDLPILLFPHRGYGRLHLHAPNDIAPPSPYACPVPLQTLRIVEATVSWPPHSAYSFSASACFPYAHVGTVRKGATKLRRRDERQRVVADPTQHLFSNLRSRHCCDGVGCGRLLDHSDHTGKPRRQGREG